MLKKFRNITEQNVQQINEFEQLIQDVIANFKLVYLNKKKDQLEQKLKIAKIGKKSSDLSAKTDLLEKLTNSIEKNKNKLNYLKEDYQKAKNQFEQITNNLKEKKIQTNDLTAKKKGFFDEINKITREMEKAPRNSDSKDLDLNIKPTPNTSNYEKIKAFRKKAKECQYQVNKINQQILEQRNKLEEIRPKYEQIKSDYEKLLDLIQKDEKRVANIKKDLQDNFKKDHEDLTEDLNLKSIDITETPQQIELEIQQVNAQLNPILEKWGQEEYTPSNLFETIKKKINNYSKALNQQKDTLTSPLPLEDIKEVINHFRKVEDLLSRIEAISNTFLKEINLKTLIQILLDMDSDAFLIQFKFIRSQKEHIGFQDLTTPEKVFFVTILHIAFKILTNTQKIIFSNLFLPKDYNKRGSLYRTIRKALPIFKEHENYNQYSLLFIISKLEMKKPIKGINLIEIEES
ncbi:MAG: hypothetical protein EU548_00720 [Promethearchaeota archaeon]|nr:MAG: hypothetical protein EU548_00720 [Candidatus Lokiarchaeota archaeon]